MGQVCMDHLVATPRFVLILDCTIVGASLHSYAVRRDGPKRMGIGSGISLFIMAGVAQGILWSIFSPVPAQDGPVGIIPFIIDSAINWPFIRCSLQKWSITKYFWTYILHQLYCQLLVYVQGIHIDIPIVSTKYRGFTAVYPIKLIIYL